MLRLLIPTGGNYCAVTAINGAPSQSTSTPRSDIATESRNTDINGNTIAGVPCSHPPGDTEPHRLYQFAARVFHLALSRNTKEAGAELWYRHVKRLYCGQCEVTKKKMDRITKESSYDSKTKRYKISLYMKINRHPVRMLSKAR